MIDGTMYMYTYYNKGYHMLNLVIVFGEGNRDKYHQRKNLKHWLYD